jgi:hypothetical protein
MAACEKCWKDACLRELLLGGFRADHYQDLLRERADNPCPQAHTHVLGSKSMRHDHASGHKPHGHHGWRYGEALTARLNRRGG